MSKHQKHPKLIRPQLGKFGRNEWAILGTTCGNIQTLAKELANILENDYSIAYIDAAHGKEEGEQNTPFQNKYTDKISFHQFDQYSELSEYDFKMMFSQNDLLLINGNHFVGQKQIVVLDPEKLESLSRKTDRLSDVQLILKNGVDEIPEFLQAHIKENTPILNFAQTEQIAQYLQKQSVPAPLYGLVLAGGKSQRMGQDKGLMNYHGKPQRLYLYEKLNAFCEQTFISCRSEQLEELPNLNLIEDRFVGLSAFGAILSAFQQNPNAAYLVLACDMPLVNSEAIAELVNQRQSKKVATAFLNEATQFPDPLFTIYEPKAYPRLLQFLAQAYACPRKMLINSDIQIIEPSRPEILKNANTPEDFAEIKNYLT